MTGKELHLFFVLLCRLTNRLFISCNLCPVRLPHGAAGLKRNNMLYNITWQHYCLYVAIALALWYGVFFWIYYGGKAGNLFRKRDEKHLPDGDLLDPNETDDDLLGKPAEEYGISTVGSEDISFGVKPAGADQTDAFNREDDLRGLVPDVMEEIKSIVHTIEIQGGTKEDFISLFKLVSSKYPRIISSRQFQAINEWTISNTPFELTEKELSLLWE